MMSMKVPNNLYISIFSSLFLYDAIQKTSEGGLVMPRIISKKKRAESSDRKRARRSTRSWHLTLSPSTFWRTPTKDKIVLRSNIDMALVQRFLQYSSAATTQRYIGIEPQKIEQAIQNHAHLLWDGRGLSLSDRVRKMHCRRRWGNSSHHIRCRFRDDILQSGHLTDTGRPKS